MHPLRYDQDRFEHNAAASYQEAFYRDQERLHSGMIPRRGYFGQRGADRGYESAGYQADGVESTDLDSSLYEVKCMLS